MLSPSDFNNAVPQFTNGDYASNPINPQYIAEPDAENYNRGTEPLQTLPAQWWNWFLNRFTNRFNKVNVYVKNIFNELAQVLSIFNISPNGTEQTPTTSQLKTVFETCYPEYIKTMTTGTAVGCIPTVGTALGTTNNNILVTDSTGKLKPSGITVGTAAGCDASLFARKAEIDNLYGNIAGCPLGTAAVGTATTFARSDHVHPLQTSMPSTGFGYSSFTYLQTDSSFAGSSVEWAHYLISNHYCGANYYNYIIREPFTTVPQYSRMVNGTQSGWYNFITDENIGSQCVCFASDAGYASQANHATEALCADNACCLEGYCANIDPLAYTVALRNSAGQLYSTIFRDCFQTENIKNYSNVALLFKGNDGYHRSTCPADVCVGCAGSSLRSQAAYIGLTTYTLTGGGIATICYCAINADMPWITESYVVLNGIKAGQECQFDFSTFNEFNKIHTADGKDLGTLCVDGQWHQVAVCAFGGQGTSTCSYSYHVQLASIVG